MSTSSDAQGTATAGADIVFNLTNVRVTSADGTVLLKDGTGTFYGSFGPNTIKCGDFSDHPKVGELYTISANQSAPASNWKCTFSGPSSSFVQQQR